MYAHSSVASMVGDVASLASLSFFASLHDPYLGISLLAAYLIYTLYRAIIERKLDYLSSDIADYEQTLLSTSNFVGDSNCASLQKLFLTSHTYERVLISCEVLAICLCFASSAVVALLHGSFDAFSLLVYGATSYHCISSLGRIWSFPTLLNEKKKEEAFLHGILSE